MEILIGEVNIDDCVLELSSQPDNSNSIPAEDAVLSRHEIIYTIRQESRLGVDAVGSSIWINGMLGWHVILKDDPALVSFRLSLFSWNSYLLFWLNTLTGGHGYDLFSLWFFNNFFFRRCTLAEGILHVARIDFVLLFIDHGRVNRVQIDVICVDLG